MRNISGKIVEKTNYTFYIQ